MLNFPLFAAAMCNELNFRRTDFPADWNDDVRMNFLFSPFRERFVNPEGYDDKMNFWMNTIQDLCLRSTSPVFSQLTLSSALERKHKQPTCLDVVLENMLRQGIIMTISEYSKVEASKGWIGWGYDLLVQKPVALGFSYVQNLLNWTKKDDRFVVTSVMKELAEKLLQRYYELINTKWTDNAVFLEHFKQECTNICSASNFQLAVIELQRENKACVFEEYGEKVIKFRKVEEKRIKPLSELDKGVLSLNRVKDTINGEMDVIEKEILNCQEAARDYVKKGQKRQALRFLKKRQEKEALLTKKSNALDTVENLLCKLKNAGSEKMVLEAYRNGVAAMKGVISGGLDLDSVDDIMADVKETLDDFSEIQTTLGKSVLDDNSLEEYEAELGDILAEEQEKNAAQAKMPSPPRPTEEELLRRLSALRAPPEGVPPIKKKALNKPLRAP